MTATSRASRPCILCASLPKAITSPVILLIATTEGSSTTTPRPRTAIIVLADPISIAIESETRFRSALRPINEPVLAMIDIKQKVNDYGPLFLPVIVHHHSSPRKIADFQLLIWSLALGLGSSNRPYM